MHLRRALLLFAIVLGLGAIAASVSRERREPTPDAPTPPARVPEATPGPRPATTAVLRFADGGRRERRTVAPGRAVEVRVSASEPGIAEIPRLALSGAVNPRTPARFDVLRGEPGRFPVAFTPAGGHKRRSVGTLLIEP